MNRRPEMIPPSLFHPARTLSGSLRSPPSPRGEGFVSKIPLSPFRSLPHWGRGTASAVDRVLSLIVDLRCISSLSFIPLSPSNLRPFGAPPSIGRRECPHEPLPLEGAAERSEAGLAFFLGRRSRLLFAFPIGKGVVSRKMVSSYRSLPHWGRGTASAVDRVLSYIVDLRRISPLSFIPLEPYPARSARHLPHAGKALSVVILFPHMRVFALTMREKRYPRIVAFPIGEGGPRSGG